MLKFRALNKSIRRNFFKRKSSETKEKWEEWEIKRK